MLKKIKNDEYIQDCYMKVDAPDIDCGFLGYLGFNHVIDMVEKILIQVGCDDESVEHTRTVDYYTILECQ